MKKVIILLVAMLVGASFQLVKAQDANNPYVHCVILDKTMSMTGHGGTNIWADVQNYCYEWVEGVSQPSTVLFFTFDKNLYGPQIFEIKSDSDKEKFKDAVRNIKVDGKFTYISSNLGKAIDHVYQNYPKASYNNRFYLITDGIEEELGSDFAGVMKKYSGKRGDYDYLFYVDLRDLATEEIRYLVDETDGSIIGPGFPKLLTVSPMFSNVRFKIGQSKFIEQKFIVSNEEMISGISFSVKVDSVVMKDAQEDIVNVDLTPSLNIGESDLKRIEAGKYKVDFTPSFDGEELPQCECDIYVSLSGRSQEDKIIVFEPNVFCIKVKNAGGKIVPKWKGLED